MEDMCYERLRAEDYKAVRVGAGKRNNGMCVFYYCRTYYKACVCFITVQSCARGGRRIVLS